jgi:Xaa-Pro aminopeptidase
VAAGANSALPHAIPGDRQIVPGRRGHDRLRCGLAGLPLRRDLHLVRGRALGPPAGGLRLVREAQARAIAAIRPGVACGEIDRIARGVLAEAGLEGCFSHGTGHGWAWMSTRRRGWLPDARRSSRPGWRSPWSRGLFPGLWGIRIEDTVQVTQTGCEILTPTAKD